MTDRKRRSGAMSATEFMAQLEKDKEYQRKKAAFDPELQERASVLRAAEQLIVAALRSVGVQADSVWDLVNTSEPLSGRSAGPHGASGAGRLLPTG